MSRVLVFGGALLFLFLGILSYVFVHPDKHSHDPYDDHSADLSGEKAARLKFDDGSSCFELMGDAHELQFRLGRCLGERMKKWKSVVSFSTTSVKSEEEYLLQVSKLRKDHVKGLPVMIDENAPRVMVLVGCKEKHFLGDLHDLLEVANSISGGAEPITDETLRKECD